MKHVATSCEPGIDYFADCKTFKKTNLTIVQFRDGSIDYEKGGSTGVPVASELNAHFCLYLHEINTFFNKGGFFTPGYPGPATAIIYYKYSVCKKPILTDSFKVSSP